MTRIAVRVLLLLAAPALLTGCPAPASPGAPGLATGPDSVALDPCAERMHEISEQVLLYFIKHRDLPAQLADLNAGVPEPLPLTCPKTNQPYRYDRAGLPTIDRSGLLVGLRVPEIPGRVIIYDAQPVHGGFRWAIMAEPARPGKPVVVHVLRLSPAQLSPPASPPSTGRDCWGASAPGKAD